MELSVNKKSFKDIIRNKEVVLTVCCSVIIFFLCIRNIGITIGPYVFNDELGYLGNAAALAGKDWNYVMQECAWYSFGWSIFIAPLFVFFTDMTIIYRIIIVLNALMVVSVFLMQINILSNLFKKSNKIFIILLSACSCCYSSVLFNASIAWSETCLLFFYTLMTCFFLHMLEKPRLYKSAVWGVLVCFIYIIHNRMIGVMLVGIGVYLLCCFFKKVKIKDIILFFTALIIAYLLFDLLKDYIVSLNWRQGLPAGNDVGSGMAALKNVFTEQGFKNFIGLLCSEGIYIFIATFGLVPLGIYSLITKTITLIKEKDSDKNNFIIFTIWIVFAFLGMYVINCITTSNGDISTRRLDHLYYGRYFEPLYIILIAAGLYHLKFNRKISELVFVIFTCLTTVGTMVALNLNKSITEYNYNRVTSSGMYIYFEVFKDGHFFIFPALVIVISISVLLWFLLKNKNKYLNYTALLLCVGAFLINMSSVDKTTKDSQINQLKTTQIISNIKNEMKKDDILYFLGTASYYQCMLPNITLRPIKNLNVIEDDEYKIIIPKSELLNVLSKKSFDVIGANDSLVFAKPSSENSEKTSVSLPLNFFYLKEGTTLTNDGKITVSASDKGYLAFYGPYLPINQGNYTLSFDMDITYDSLTAPDVLGTIQVYSNSNKTVYEECQITPQMLTQENILLDFSIPSDINDMEIYLITQPNVSYLLNNVNIAQQYQNEYLFDGSSIISGFSSPEGTITWAVSKNASLTCFLPDKDTTATITFGYSLPFEKLGIDSYDVDILMNEKSVGKVTLKPNVDDTFVIPISDEVLEEGKNELSFVGEMEWSPSDYGSADNRTLSFSLESVEFEPAA